MRKQKEGGSFVQRIFNGVVLQLLILSFEPRTTVRTEKGPGPGPGPGPGSGSPVQLRELPGHVEVDNGIVCITIATPCGHVTGIRFNGIDNILDETNKENDRGYWDINWHEPKANDELLDKLDGQEFEIVKNTPDQVELSFKREWNPSMKATHASLNVDKRFVVLRGCSGFYSYGILERLKGWPDIDVSQGRIVFKIHEKLFRYMAVSDTRQRIMPMYVDREKGEPLAYPEAVRLTNPTDPSFKGEVDDKYMYSAEMKDYKVHGWACSDPPTGFWMITPSTEFVPGGPVKQDLTSHTGPFTLSMFWSTHYAGEDQAVKYREGVPWKKVFGPVFIYLNCAPTKGDHKALWNNAKQQMTIETGKWPYDFPASDDFLCANQRGTVDGRLQVNDGEGPCAAKNAFIGLALPGTPGSWQFENLGYQFWTQADADGKFCINNVLPGAYNLYAWVPGFIGDFMHPEIINVAAGVKMSMGDLVYVTPRIGPTVWEIGIPDRTAAEFFVPEPSPACTNKLFTTLKADAFRQYGLWDRYTELHPRDDLVFTVGTSKCDTDWFFAHVPRNLGNNKYGSTMWTIAFDLPNVSSSGIYKLQMALASANAAEVQVRVNDPNTLPAFTTMLIGKDNAIARHGIHGIHHFFSINVPGSKLRAGKNSIYLTQARSVTAFCGVMYDYLRLEAPGGAQSA